MQSYNFLEKNGVDLRQIENKQWVCIKTRDDWGSFKLARKFYRNNINFFVPCYYDLKGRLRGLFPGYIFCRVLKIKLQTFFKYGQLLQIEGNRSEQRLLSELKEFTKEVRATTEFKTGEEIEVISGSLQGITGPILEINDDLRKVKVNLNVFKRTFGAWVSKNDVISKERKVRFDFLTSDKFFLEQEFDSKDEYYEDDDQFFDLKRKEEIQEKELLEKIDFSISEINAELIRYLAKNPKKLYDLPSRKFEILVAELLKDMGYDVRLTPETRDGGRDILAVIKIPPGKEILTIVECKRYSANNKIGIDILERFLWILERNDKANGGLIATTSFFSNDAIKRQKEFAWLLSLYDFNHLSEWLKKYGSWKRDNEGIGLWLPDTYKP